MVCAATWRPGLPWVVSRGRENVVCDGGSRRCRRFRADIGFAGEKGPLPMRAPPHPDQRRSVGAASAAPVGLSLLAHVAVLLVLALLVLRRTEPPTIPTEETVALVFDVALASRPPAADVAQFRTADVSQPSEPDIQSTESHLPLRAPPPPVPPAPSQAEDIYHAARVQPPLPQPRAEARGRVPPGRPLASPPQVRSPELPASQPEASVSIQTGANDPIVPPRPVAGMETNRPPSYPEAARRRGEQGRVTLRVSVSAEGAPREVDVLTTSGHPILDSAALAAVRHWRFAPATRTGRPVAAIADVPIRFRLEN